MKDTLNIALDFSKYPGGRFTSHGPYSGQEFRDSILFPRFNKIRKVDGILNVILDGTRGYGSSFLEEAFGGLVRNYKIDSGDVLKHIEFTSENDPSLIIETQEYIRKAKPKAED